MAQLAYEASGVGRVEDLTHHAWRVGQRSALDGLHHREGHAMCRGDLVVGPGLDAGLLHVGIVDLQLDEVDVGVFGEQALQALRTSVEREAPPTDDALLLEAANPVPQPKVVVHLLVVVLDGMEQVVVQVVDSQALHGDAKLVLGLLGGGVPQPGVGLGGHRKRVARVALHQRLARGNLGIAAVVDIGGVEVGESRPHKDVDHLADLLHVHGAVFQLGQAHHAKA